MILGTGSYKAGYNAAIFRAKTDAGLGWLKGDGDPAVVKSFYLDEAAGRKVAARARAMREKTGVLSGYALGEDDSGEIRSFAADVLAVFGADTRLWNETIAARLAERFPGVYADITAAAVGSQLRGIGVTVKNVREPGRNPNSGCERGAVEAAAGAVLANA
jgi:S-DNA-T family DNA segregation ATPase FtsK/SpoIIIE